VSRWLADELHISLSPGQVGVVQVRRNPGLKGVNRQVVSRQSLACDSDPQAPVWDGAMLAMDTLLPRYVNDHPNVIVVLSNHFVRYVLVPWSDLISNEEQQLAYARHCFQMTYGVMAATWKLRLSRSTVGASQLASAVDEQLLVACNEMINRHGLRLTSVQPYLMSAFNRFKPKVQRTDAWFALVETGCICLARLQHGRWIRLKTARLGSGWEEFSRFVVREAFMEGSDLQAEERVLYMYAPHLGRLQTISGWKIFELPPPLPSNLPGEEDNSLVMALSG